MQHFLIKLGLFIFLFTLVRVQGLPQSESEMLCVGHYQTEEEAIKQLEAFKLTYSDLKGWLKRSEVIREGIIRGAELDAIPSGFREEPGQVLIHGKHTMDGYTVENIAVESMPGFYITGNLYKPGEISGKIPAILCPHGHWSDPEDYGRFRKNMQIRCSALARMGAVVIAYDMIGFGEAVQCEHNHPRGLQIQTFNSLSLVDFLISLDYVDPLRIAVTGASGGGTQSFLLTAIDKRITVSVPVVQVSAHFFGGCTCESGMPIHKSNLHETNNVEIAALAAPRPMLLISDGDDWTKNTPEVEYPYIRDIYKLFGAIENLEYSHFPDEKHDYGYSKRAAAYYFLAKHLDLDISRILNSTGEVDEGSIILLSKEELLVFDKSHPFPSNAVMGNDAVTELLRTPH